MLIYIIFIIIIRCLVSSSHSSLLLLLQNWAAADSYYSQPQRQRQVVQCQAHARRWLARRNLKVARLRRDQKKSLVDNMVVDELHESERAYVRDLTTLIKHFVEPLRLECCCYLFISSHFISFISLPYRLAPKPVVSPDDMKVLFMEVEVLHAANQKFLLLLGALPNPRTCLSLTEVFFNLCNFLKVPLYSSSPSKPPCRRTTTTIVTILMRCCSSPVSKSRTRTLRRSSPPPRSTLTSVTTSRRVHLISSHHLFALRSLPLSYLTKPILRASLYPLLLEKMLRKIPATHIEHEGLTGVHVRSTSSFYAHHNRPR